MRAALNELATEAGDSRKPQLQPGWLDCYERRFDDYRLLKGRGERWALAAEIGADGHHLLQAIFPDDCARTLRPCRPCAPCTKLGRNTITPFASDRRLVDCSLARTDTYLFLCQAGFGWNLISQHHDLFCQTYPYSTQ